MATKITVTDRPCPDAEQHTVGPPGYLAFFEWAALMNKTHRQCKCSGCGCWMIWRPRRATTEPQDINVS